MKPHKLDRRGSPRKAALAESRRDRLFSKTVKLTRALPSWNQLHAEACQYHGKTEMDSWRVIAYIRHTYTNYDMLCGKVKEASAVNKEICATYKRQANKLIHDALGSYRREWVTNQRSDRA